MLASYVQELSSADNLEEVLAVVKRAARELTGSDGATVVLREKDLCFYADEYAIGPLWKGRRFPMSACISGWVMETGETAVIEDIYQDPRIPHDAYRPTFVKSLAMVPIRKADPVGAIGNYWARHNRPTRQQLDSLEAFAAATSVAFENLRLRRELFDRPADRNGLAAENRDLKLFSRAISHDLRTPLRAIGGYTRVLTEDWAGTAEAPEIHDYLVRISRAVERMSERVNGLHRLSRLSSQPLESRPVMLSALAEEVVEELLVLEPERPLECRIEPELVVDGDPGLLQILLENLFSNALKFTRDRRPACIEFGTRTSGRDRVFYLRDNGVGFAMEGSERILAPFERLHDSEFQGLGLGMTTVRRITDRHGGQLWWDAAVDRGASFFFTLSPSADDEPPRHA